MVLSLSAPRPWPPYRKRNRRPEGVGEERGERELGGTDQRRVLAETGRPDLQVLLGRDESGPLEPVLDQVLARRPHLGQHTADHDDLGVEKVHDRAQSDTSPVRHGLQRRSGAPVASLDGGDDLGDRVRATTWQPARVDQQMVLAHLGLPAAERSTPAYGTDRVHRDVTNLTGVPLGAPQGHPADEETAADADTAAEVRRVLELHGCAPQML